MNARLGAALTVATITVITPPAPSASDPWQLLLATGVVDAGDRSRLDTGGAVVTILPGRGPDLAVFGVVRTTASGDRLARWTTAVEQLYRGPYLPVLRRFSEPPQLADVGALVLEDEELDDLRKCRPGDCGVKLSAREMHEIRAAAAAAGAAWKPAVQTAFRRVVVARARAYLERGAADIDTYDDRQTPVSPASEFTDIASHIGFEPLYGGQVVRYLQSFPRATAPTAESFLYWSKETLGAGKPIVSITHVAVFRNPPPEPAAPLVGAPPVYATHYLTGSLSLTLVTNGTNGKPAYLVYLRRSRTDAFAGLFGGFVRHIVEGRIKADAPALLDGLRRRLEGGEPPIVTTVDEDEDGS